MKKIITIIILYIILIPSVQANSSSSYVVLDKDSNNVLYGSNIHDKHLIASISKIMTCIIAIEKGNLDDIITVDKSILKSIGSSIYLEVGEKISLKELLYGMMLRSGNDAATVIANHISGDMESFSILMNEYAKKIKMNDSLFYNSHGLENSDGVGNISSSYDMAILTSYAMNNKIFRKIFSTKNYIAKSNNKTYSWQNKNKLLKYDYINGGKTGYTIKAGRTLVSSASINNMNIIIVTINDPNDWNDHLDIYNNIKNNYSNILILKKNDIKNALKSINDNKNYYIVNNFYLTLKNEDIKNLKIRYIISSKQKHKGYVSVYLKDDIIYTDRIKYKAKNKTFFSKLLYKIKKIFF